MAKKSSKGGGGNLFMGFLLGAATVVGGGYAWMHYGGSKAKLTNPLSSLPSLPAGMGSDGGKSGDPAMASVPTPAPRPHQKPKPPFGTSEEVFEDGAHVYRARCASCHGTPNIVAPQVKGRVPAPQLWKNTKVSGWDPGDIYTRIAEGKHGSMPPFAGHLSHTQIWQVALLLDNSGNELPDPVVNILEKK